MVLITCLDSLLMLTTTETVVSIDVDYDYEMQIGAMATILNAFLGGQPVYSQTKFAQVGPAPARPTRAPDTRTTAAHSLE